MTGKISHLPRHIRNQLNRRLDDAEPHHSLLAWLNSLPEVQAILATHFEAQPITKQNLYAWSQHGFRHWKMRQDALEFACANAEMSTAQSPPAPNLVDHLVNWLATRYAATANSLPPAQDDPEAELRRLRALAADIVALRRGDLYASRLALDQQRLAMLQDEVQQKRQKAEAQRKQGKRMFNNLLRNVPEIIPYLAPDEPDPPSQNDSMLDPALLI